MSGEISRKPNYKNYSKGKKPAAEPGLDNVQKSRKARPYKTGSGAGFCLKTIFFMLFSTFTLIGTLVYFDYQPGQLKEAYTTQVPLEVRVYLDKGFEKANIVWHEVQNFTVESWNRGSTMAREWTRAVNIGNMTLEDIIFSEEIREEQLEARQKATEKLKAAIDIMNKKIQEEQAKAEADAKLAEEQAKKQAEEEKVRLAQEAEAKKLAEEQAKQKAAEELKLKQEAEAKKLAEEQAKKQAEEAALKLQQKAEAKRVAEEQARKQAEELKLKQEAEANKLAEEQARKQAEELKLKQEAEAKKLVEEQATKQAEEAALKLQQEAKAKRVAEEQARKQAEELKLKQEAEAKRVAKEQARKQAEELKLKQEAEAKKLAEEQAKKQAEEDALKLQQEAEAKKVAEEQAKKKADKELKLKQEAEAKKLAEEQAKKQAEEVAIKLKQEMEAKKLAEEQAQKQAEQDAYRKQLEAEAKKMVADEKARLEKEAQAAAEAAQKLAQQKENEEKQKAAREAEIKKLKEDSEKKKIAEEAAAVKQKEELENEKKKAEMLEKETKERARQAEAKKIAEENEKRKADELKKQTQAQEPVKPVAEEQREKRETKDDPPSTITLESYPKKDLTNAQDFLIRDQLDHLEREVMMASTELDPAAKLRTILPEFEALLTSSQNTSPRAMYGYARVLDLLAHEEESNSLLEKAIQGYTNLLSLEADVPAELFKKAGKKCSQLMEFRGWTSQAIQVQKLLVSKFPDLPDLSNRLGLLYMLSGNNQAAKDAFRSVLEKSPTNSYASAHLGFLVKTGAGRGDVETLQEGVTLLQTGLAKKNKDVLDGRFFLHLGDGLRRLGKSQEADIVFQDGAELGLFPSFWQRSLFNVDGLKAQPLWTLAETGIEDHLATFVDNWQVIRDEALEVLKDDHQPGFIQEGENLADTGFWAQFELYRQGQKITKNCLRTPVTCALVDNVPQVSSNRRGQVKFSLMRGGTHAFAHAGPTNCRLRSHLGLSVQSSSQAAAKTWSGLRVADKFVTWNEGQMFVFDDSFDHEVWNENDGRIVLIIDLWHPDLTQKQKDTLSAI